MVAGGAAVAAQEAFEPRPLLTVVAIHVTDYAHLSPLDLANAEARATAGLMRPIWNPPETRLQTFTASQVQAIRYRFTTTAAR